jgi:hypothetical protein
MSKRSRVAQRADKPIMYNCFLCEGAFQFGPHVYKGQFIQQWDIMVCHGCYGGNHDGVVPGTWPHLMSHLKSKGIDIKLNARGWIVWPS